MSGIVTGKLELLHVEVEIIVLKEHGRHYYTGQGQPQRYSPATFRVLRVIEGSVGDGRCEVEQLARWLCRPQVGTAEPYRL
jgi:hypothetical protein